MTGTMVNKQESRNVPTDAVIQGLKKAIEALKYGMIIIKVHNGKIAQVEITEKRRFNEPLEFEKGDGI
ncbi:MAG: YezD family protein [Phycisphaerae bacterium]|nr:YezD family protein [Phycisphaerae bacterium]